MNTLNKIDPAVPADDSNFVHSDGPMICPDNKRDRPTRDLWAGILFALSVVIGFVLCAVVFANSLSLQEIINRCDALGAIGYDVGTLEGTLEDQAGIFAACVIMCYICGVAWLCTFRYIAKGMAIAVLILKPVLMFSFGVFLIAAFDDATETGIFFIIGACLYVAFFVYIRKRIRSALELIQVAANFISENTALITFSVIWASVTALYSIMFIFAFVKSIYVGDVIISNGFCRFEQAGYVQGVQWTMLAIWLWGVSMLGLINCYVIGTVCAHWYFSETEAHPEGAAGAIKQGISRALSVHAGTVAIAAILGPIADYLKIAGESKCGPLGCFPWMLYKCLAGCLSAISQLLVISAALTGQGFGASAQHVFNIIKHHFVKGVITTELSSSFVNAFAFLCPLAWGAICWAWIVSASDPKYDGYLFDNRVEAKIFFMFFVGILVRYKYLGILLLSVMPAVIEQVLGSGLAVGLFLFYMMNILMVHMAKIATFGVSSTLVMYAFDRENQRLGLPVRSDKTDRIDGYAKQLKGYIPLAAVGGVQQV